MEFGEAGDVYECFPGLEPAEDSGPLPPTFQGPSPCWGEMAGAYEAIRARGLKNVRLGNAGVFARGEGEIQWLLKKVGRGSFGKEKYDRDFDFLAVGNFR